MDNFILLAKQLFDVDINHQQMEMFKKYEELLMEWNTRMNLTAITEKKDIENKHFLDSLSCFLVLKHIPLPDTVIDVGTGAGFPGFVLKILVPNLHITLVESVGKKILFCKHIQEIFHFSNTEIIQDRAEVLGQKTQYRERYDCAVARALAPLSVLSEYLLPFVKVGGIMVAMKGNKLEEELQDATHAISLLGGKLKQIDTYFLPQDSDPRALCTIDKIAKTPTTYPRSVGIPKKNPLG